MNQSGGPSGGSFAFADHMFDAAATFSLPDRRFHYLNAAVERILGLRRQDILDDASLPFALIVDEHRGIADAFFAQAESEGTASAEFRIRRRDGQECWLAVRAFPVEGGESMRGLIGEDITERKHFEQALRESEARFRQIAEHIDEVFWIVSPDGTHVHYVSPAYEKIWGRPPDELYASPFKWVQAIDADDQARVLEAVTLHQAERALEMQFRMRRADGCQRYIRHRSVPVRDAAGIAVQVVSTSEDITEQKRLELQAEESARAQRDALVREVHHRIKNNLQGVTGMLRNYANRRPEVSTVINEAIAQVQAVAVIYGLQGRPGAARVMFDDLLKEVVSGICQLMHRAVTLSSDEKALGCRTVVGELEAVPVALVLNEIVFNAVKHTAADATIAIDTKIDIAKEQVSLTVINPGRLAVGAPASGGGSGLQLIHSLLPRRGARFDLTDSASGVVAKLTLGPPIVALKC